MCRGPARREFIMSKYVQRKFIIRTSFAGAGGIMQQPRLGAPAGARRPQSTVLVVNTDLKFDLRQAVCAADLSSLLQVYAEGILFDIHYYCFMIIIVSINIGSLVLVN